MEATFLIITALALALQGAAALGGWSYEDADEWPSQFPSCGGRRQSPIDFNRFSVHYSYTPPFKFTNYDVLPSSMTVTNTGYNLRVNYASAAIPTISSGGLKGTYNLTQFHLHWGKDDTRGSEHTFDSVRYPMELHMIHFNSKYGDLATAFMQPDGLAVIAVMFVLSPFDNPALTPLLNQVEEIHEFESDDIQTETFFNLQSFSSLLPHNRRRVYRYKGGITSPPCNEVVTWTIYDEPLGVSRAQLEILRTMTDAEGEQIADNFRPIQLRNGRKVTRSFWK